MASRRRNEGGKKPNAEGMHGDRTHEAIQEQLKHKLPEPVDPALRPNGEEEIAADEAVPLRAHAPLPDGKHRLREARQQHDEADKNSEKNRIARDNHWGSVGNK
jgi:hypothetical protein